MAKMKAEHGSELHMLRFLGRHREQLDNAILAALNGDGAPGIKQVEWLDFHFDKKNAPYDGEWQGVDFLDGFGGAGWREYWPDKKPGQINRKGVPTWDAIGKLHFAKSTEWLLVEAKAHEGELASRCKAEDKVSLRKIEDALLGTYVDLTSASEKEWKGVRKGWLEKYYQKANRLACLRFLNEHSQAARLLYVYFYGDTFFKRPIKTEADWRKPLVRANRAMGLAGVKAERVHEIFLPVKG